MTLFSIVIPTFNAGDKLRLTLDSIRSQEFVDAKAELEIVVQDGASSDGTKEFLQSQRDMRWQSAPDKGVYDGMNRGIENARGAWLAFFGAGDILRPGALQALQVFAEQKRGSLALIYGDAWLCEEGFRYGGAFSRRKLRNWTPSHQAIFYNRRIFQKLGGYELKYPISADYALQLKCWGDSEIEKIYIPEILCDYEGRGLSKTVHDTAFERDKMRLIRQRLGWDAWLLRRMELLMPRALKDARVKMLQKRARSD